MASKSVTLRGPNRDTKYNGSVGSRDAGIARLKEVLSPDIVVELKNWFFNARIKNLSLQIVNRLVLSLLVATSDKNVLSQLSIVMREDGGNAKGDLILNRITPVHY